MQKILTVSRNDLPAEWVENGAKIKIDTSSLREVLQKISPVWMNRPEAEADPSHKQLIPYAVVRYKNSIACYKRSGAEKRLHDLYSIGVGGHVDIEDDQGDIVDTLLLGLGRELSEEFADFSKEHAEISFLGVLNSEDTEVSSVHLGMVFEIQTTKKLLPDSELTGFEWADPKILKSRKLENWSELALAMCE